MQSHQRHKTHCLANTPGRRLHLVKECGGEGDDRAILRPAVAAPGLRTHQWLNGPSYEITKTGIPAKVLSMINGTDRHQLIGITDETGINLLRCANDSCSP